MRINIADRHDAFDRQLLVDIGVVGFLVAFLTTVHVGLPARYRAMFVFNHDMFEPWTLLTSAYIHHDITHLLNNIGGFLLATGLVYWLCWKLDARRWFRITTATFVIILPILVNLSSYAIFSIIVPNASPAGRGFSGVVAGFVGFLFAALMVWIAAQTSRTMAAYLGGAVAVFMVWTLAVIYRGFEVHVAGLVLIGIGFSSWGILTELDLTRLGDRLRQSLPAVCSGLGIVLALLWFLLALFPPDFVSGEVATNIFAHAAGFAWGTLLALVLWANRSQFF